MRIEAAPGSMGEGTLRRRKFTVGAVLAGVALAVGIYAFTSPNQEALPGDVKVIAGNLSFTPEGAGVSEIATPAMILVLFAAVFPAIASMRFRVEESKVYVA